MRRSCDRVVEGIHAALDRLEATRPQQAIAPPPSVLPPAPATLSEQPTATHSAAAVDEDAEEDKAENFLGAITMQEDTASSVAPVRTCSRRQGRREAKKAARLARQQTPEGQLRRQRTAEHRANAHRKRQQCAEGEHPSPWVTVADEDPLDGQPRVVILYYKYCDVPDPEAINQWQAALCRDLKLNGRIRLGAEGINGTLAGRESDIAKYQSEMDKSELFSDIQFKSSADSVPSAFRNLRVRVVKEICTLGLAPDAVSFTDCGEHVAPERFHQAVKDGELVLDVRNEYEAAIGKFENAVTFPQMRQFSDFVKCVEPLLPAIKDTQRSVYMYCTGGVRCERASAYLKSCGVDEVYQLDGGIHCYMEQFPTKESAFVGKNFVFDARVSQDSGRPEVIGKCGECEAPFDEYSDDRRCVHCRNLVLVCFACQELVEARRAANTTSAPVGYICEQCRVSKLGDTANV